MYVKLRFWLPVVLCLAIIAHCLDVPAPGGEQSAWNDRALVYLVVFGAGLVVAWVGRILFRGGRRTAQYAAAWIVVFAIAATFHTRHGHVGAFYERLHGALRPSVALTTAAGEAQLRRAWDGHYRAEAEVNGERMQLMIDTGASMVLLPFEAVRVLGIDPDDLDFSVPVNTANGRSTVAPIRLASIRIGPIETFDVEAAVAHPGRLKVGLLGMSFIDKLTEISFRGETLTLRN